MTNAEIITWIKTNLGPIIQVSLTKAREKNPDLLYTEDWLGAICMRETGSLIAKRLASIGNLPSGRQLGVIASLMKGDYSQRSGEKENNYHGFGFWQADIGSFPQYVKSGDWKDPAKNCAFAIDVLEGKRVYLQKHYPALSGDELARAITAAYNCGEGNVGHVLEAGQDIDTRTTDRNYSKSVWEFREAYNAL